VARWALLRQSQRAHAALRLPGAGFTTATLGLALAAEAGEAEAAGRAEAKQAASGADNKASGSGKHFHRRGEGCMRAGMRRHGGCVVRV